jgi:fructosamine-3-kinase
MVVWEDHATFRVTLGAQRFVVKTDQDHDTIAREAAGYRRAAAGGIRVPELVAVADDALATAWIDGVTLDQLPTAAAWRDTGAQLRTAHDLGGGAPFGAGFGGYEPAHPTWRDFFEAFAEGELRSCERQLGFPADHAARIRGALLDAVPALEVPIIGWCHGDCQPEHVLIDPATDRVAAIIDWADHGPADIGWDVMVLTLDDPSYLDALLDGYDAGPDLRAALHECRPLFTIVRLLGEAHWHAEHNLPFRDSVRRALAWRA